MFSLVRLGERNRNKNMKHRSQKWWRKPVIPSTRHVVEQKDQFTASVGCITNSGPALHETWSQYDNQKINPICSRQALIKD